MNLLNQVSLKWDSFQDKTSSFLQDVKISGDFSDVTLVCGDGKQIEAHRIILASASPFFKEMFRRVTKISHTHPLIYISGLKFCELEQVLHFMYFGEVNIAEEQLEAFLALAEEFQLNAFSKGQLAQDVSTEVVVKDFPKTNVKVDKSSEKVKVDKPSELIRLKTELQVVTSQVARKAKEVE